MKPPYQVQIVCARAPGRGLVLAIRRPDVILNGVRYRYDFTHTCSWCGARVKVVA